jgi:molybdate transport system substrate-binding protein
VPQQWNVEAVYPIAVLAGAAEPSGAEAFVAFVLSAEGSAVLARHGFLAP